MRILLTLALALIAAPSSVPPATVPPTAAPPITSPPVALRAAGPDIFDPYTRTSPDGTWSVYVDPTERYGEGPANYRVRHGDDLVWASEKPWTMRDAAIDDNGRVAGYAYSRGSSPAKRPGVFHALMLAADGSVAFDEQHARSYRQNVSEPTLWPAGSAVCVQPELGRFVLVVSDVDGEGTREWWALHASDARVEFRKQLESAPEDRNALLEVRAVRGTPLTCARLTKWRMGGSSVRCVLFDADFKPVWRSEFLDTLPQGGDATELREAARDAFEIDAEPARFDCVLPSARVTVRFAVERADDGWKVSEVGRQPWHPPVLSQCLPAFDDLPLTTLESRGAADLEGQRAATSPVRDIVALDPRDDGLRFVRTEPDGTHSLVRVDLQGIAQYERSFELPERDVESKLAFWPLGADAWLATRSLFGTGARALAWRIDDATGVVTRLTKFDSPMVSDVAASPNGGFVVLATEHTEYTLDDCLITCDADGTRSKWIDLGNGAKAGASIPGANAVAVTSTDRIMVLSTVGRRLTEFDSDGEIVRTIQLDEVWGRRTGHPTGVTADIEGGVLVHDFQGQPQLARVNADGKARALLEPSFADGTNADALARSARVAPNGDVWATDGQRIVRLDASGLVDRIVGTPAAADVLAEPMGARFDAFGRALIADRATYVVHVFDSQGRKLFLCRPSGDVVGRVDDFAGMTSTPDGGVAFQGATRSTILRFGPAGEPLESLRVPARTFSLAISPVDGAVYAGSFGEGFSRAATPDLEALDYERAPDNTWLRGMGWLAMSRDGTLGMTARSGAKEAGRSLYLYPAGERELLRTIRLPDGTPCRSTSLGRAWAVVWEWTGAALLVELTGERRLRLQMGEGDKNDSNWKFGFDPETDELLALDVASRRILRFALP